MDAHPPELQALDALDKVLLALTRYDERDFAIEQLVDEIEQTRADLLATVIGGQATGRPPRRLQPPQPPDPGAR